MPSLDNKTDRDGSKYRYHELLPQRPLRRNIAVKIVEASKAKNVCRSFRVIIVEDEPIIALDLEIQVEDAGHIVVAKAVNMETCKRAFSADNKPDLALMDMRLKGGDSGADVAKWLRDEWDVPCIFVSASLDQPTMKNLRPLCPLGFVEKPVIPSRLAKILAAAKASIIN